MKRSLPCTVVWYVVSFYPMLPISSLYHIDSNFPCPYPITLQQSLAYAARPSGSLADNQSPDLQSMEQIRRVMRPTDVPDTGLLCDLLWSDPDKDITGWSENDRGVSFTFGPDVVSRFLQKHDMDLICRAHQVVEDGYEFFAKRQLVTLFSAPNYCGEVSLFILS